MMISALANKPMVIEAIGRVYCPMCTHTVDADIVVTRKATWVRPGQKCPRCQSKLDAGFVMRTPQAA